MSLRLFVHELRAEQLVFWRSKEAALFIFLFPLLLFLLLGSVYSGRIYGFKAPQALGPIMDSSSCWKIFLAQTTLWDSR